MLSRRTDAAPWRSIRPIRGISFARETEEHFFFNGTTAYWLVGWIDDRVSQYSVDLLHRLKVNRIRMTIAGREAVAMFGEPVMIDKNWTCLIAAWTSPDAPNADDWAL